MAKKIKQTAQKSFKKTLLTQIEGKLVESLKEFPKKLSEKKYRKKIHKAGKILTNSLALKPVKVSSKSVVKKTKKKNPEINTEAVS